MIREHGVPDLATNLMTMTLTALVTESGRSGKQSERWKRRLLSIVLFVASAALGASLLKATDLTVALGLTFVVMCTALLFLSKKRVQR